MLTQLRYLCAIMDYGGMTAAAEVLGVSQPTLTRSLQALEFQLDTRLIERNGRTMTCTLAGELVVGRARILLAEHESLLQDVKRLNVGQTAVTYVNCSPIAAIALMPRILSYMAIHHPEFPVAVRGENGANYEWKLEALLSGELDLAITLYDPAFREPNLMQELLVEPEIRILVHRDHPAAHDPNVQLQQLMNYRWIMPPSGSGPRAVLENEFTLQGLNLPPDTIEISDWRIALDVMRAGTFIIAVPYHPAYFSHQLDELVVLPVKFKTRSLSVSIVVRAVSQGRPATRALIAAARQVVADFS